MAFDEKDWEKRLGKAQTQEEFRALIREIPHGPPMTPDDPDYSFMEPTLPTSKRSTSTTIKEKT